MKMKGLILVKLGGSLITDKSKPFTAKPEVIKRLALEIKKAKKKIAADLIVGHGSGSFGHTLASKYKTQEGLINKDSLRGFCLVSETAVDIDRIVLKEFLRAGLAVFSFSPATFIYSKSDKLGDIFLSPIERALKLGLIPIVYGDVVYDKLKGFTIYSGEKTLDILARKLGRKYRETKVIQCGDTDGVYDEKGRTIPRIDEKIFVKLRALIGSSKATDVTGGMLHKVEESLNIAKIGIPSLIINGGRKDKLFNTLLGKKFKGTKIET